jgi:uncharacterized protein (TIGR03000 family)
VRLATLLPACFAFFLSMLAPLAAQTPVETPVLIFVTLPADAILEVDGVAVKQTGPQRRLITPPIAFGQTAKYTLKATFSKDGQTVSVERTIAIVGGKETSVDFTKEAPKIVVEPKKVEPKKVEPKPPEVKKEPDPKKVEPKVEPKKAEPKVEPKVEPKTMEPKVEPKKVEPKVEPKKPEPKKEAEPKKELRLDVPYVPTPDVVVEAMLKLADVKPSDVVYDLGCGDGRIVVTAVTKYKAKKGLGIELAPERVKLSKANAERNGVKDKVEIREGDVLKIQDVSEASVVTLYLLPDINEKLKPMLQKTLKPGSRVVSHDFDMGDDWKPEKEVTVKDETGREHTIFLWTIPEPKKVEPKKEVPKSEPKKDEPTIKVPYVPTPQNVVEEMLKMAGVKAGDVVYDLGCGDGRIVVTAVKKFGAKRGVGIDLDPERVKDSNNLAKNEKVVDNVEFRQGDVLKLTDLSDASVVTLYLFPEVNERLQPILQKTLKPGSRIVSHDFLMKSDWKPEKELTVKDAGGDDHTIFLWTIPDPKSKPKTK